MSQPQKNIPNEPKIELSDLTPILEVKGGGDNCETTMTVEKDFKTGVTTTTTTTVCKPATPPPPPSHK